MFANIFLLATAFQVGPFYEQRPDFAALRPFWSRERETQDVIWPLFASHRDWWRFCWFVHWQDNASGGYQFEVMPLWFNGSSVERSPDGANEEKSYWGLFPLYGHHPHFLLMHDLRFALWPLWTQYRMPRPSEDRWMTTNAVLFPFFHWRDDGSWGLWPLCGVNHQRESDHRYALWPIATWADYREDRDTAGAGTSWMLWPLAARVVRERETQTMVLPPLFSWAELRSPAWLRAGNSSPEYRFRCPWPILEGECRSGRSRFSLWPLYERVVNCDYKTGKETARVTRFGWKLVELYDHETRVFPFWTSRDDGSHFRLWPFWEEERTEEGAVRGRCLSLFPIRWVDSVDRNWAKFWTFYEQVRGRVGTEHSLLWGLVRWRTRND